MYWKWNSRRLFLTSCRALPNIIVVACSKHISGTRIAIQCSGYLASFEVEWSGLNNPIWTTDATLMQASIDMNSVILRPPGRSD